MKDSPSKKVMFIKNSVLYSVYFLEISGHCSGVGVKNGYDILQRFLLFKFSYKNVFSRESSIKQQL